MAKKVQDLTTGKTTGTTTTLTNTDQATDEQKAVATKMADKVNYPNRTSADAMKKTKTSKSQLQTQFEKRQQEAQKGINAAYDKTLANQTNKINKRQDKNDKAWESAEKATKKYYTAVSKDVQQQIKQNGQGLNTFAQTNGINTGAGSQQSLQLNQVRSTSRGQIQAQRIRALEENTRQRELAKTDSQNRVAQALANHDYARAAALLDDFNNQDAWRENQAKLLAGYGNFNAYSLMYGNGQANNMKQFWIATNPEMAYNTGAINANRYKEITGKDAPDIAPTGGGGGSPVDDGAAYYHNGRPVYVNTGGGSMEYPG